MRLHMKSTLRFLLIVFLAFCITRTFAQTMTTPPPFEVRAMAEWEELQGLVVTWHPGSGGTAYKNTLTEIIRAARLECTVWVMCNSQADVDDAKSFLQSKGVDISSQVTFILAPNDSIWVRDYGPNCIYSHDVDSLYLVDWIYNRNRPYDDVMSEKIGQIISRPVYETKTAPYDLVNTGGNFMSDGMGTAFASKLVFRNNDQIANGEPGGHANDVFGTSNHTEAEIDGIMQEFMGINRYIKMDELPYDGIHHIDMHIKLLDEETLLVGKYPDNTSDGPQIEANLQYVLSNFKTSFGHDFKVVRVPMPPHNGSYPPFGTSSLYPTYANAVFVNKTVILPKYNDPLDAAAQDTFQKYLPGYHIVPVDCISIINSGGAVHCITREIGVNDPLLIQHSALSCQDNSADFVYPVSATIQHRGGISSAAVFYTTDLGAPWQTIDMQQVGSGNSHEWQAGIPHQPEGSTVYYYIEAHANDGKFITRPITAPQGYWSFCVYQSSSVEEKPVLQFENIYPNPANAITVIPVVVNRDVPGSIRILDVLGKTVKDVFRGTFSPGKNNYFFDASQLTPGIYFAEVQTPFGTYTQKLTVH